MSTERLSSCATLARGCLAMEKQTTANGEANGDQKKALLARIEAQTVGKYITLNHLHIYILYRRFLWLIPLQASKAKVAALQKKMEGSKSMPAPTTTPGY